MKRVAVLLCFAGLCLGQIVNQPSGSGSSGTVTSATIAGTANQVTASGTCTITTSGTCTLSLPSAVILPGSLSVPSGIAVGSSPALTSGTGGAMALAEGTNPSVGPAAGVDVIVANSTQHGFLVSYNNGGYAPLVVGPTSNTSANLPSFSGTAGGLLQDSGIASSTVVKGAASLTTTGAIPFQSGTTGTLTQDANFTWNATTGMAVGKPITESTNGAASTPPLSLTGTWFSGGSATTTKPQLLIEPSGTTSTAWSTDGTGLGVNAPSGFLGNVFDFKVNNLSVLNLNTTLQRLIWYENYVLADSGNRIGIYSGLGIALRNAVGMFGWSTNPSTVTFRTAFSELGAASVALGNGTEGDTTGKLTLQDITISGSAVTVSGLGAASGTPSSICRNANVMTVNAALTCTVSNETIKSNFEPLRATSDDFMRLLPAQFEYKEAPGRLRWGFGAMQVAGVNHALGDGYREDGQAWSLDQNAILALTVKTVQEQQQQLENLKSKLAKLEQ